LIEYSEYFGTSDWRKNDLSVTTNYDISPEGFKNATRVQLSNLSNARLDYNIGSTSTEENIVFSCWYKGTAGEKTFMRVNGANSGSVYKLITFTGNWQKESLAHTRFSSFNFAYPVDTRGGTEDNATDFLIYGAQLEQDATYPTSYIPTYGVSQTRLAENIANGIDIGSFTSNYNTLFFDWGDMEGKSTFNRDIVRGWATMDNLFNVFRIVCLNDGVIRYQVYTSVGGSASFTYTCTSRDKVALVLNGLNSKLFINGSLVTTYTIDVTQGLRKFNYNGLSRNVTNQFTIFPTALSDEACIELTTI